MGSRRFERRECTMYRQMKAAPRWTRVGALLIALIGCRGEPSRSTGSTNVQRGAAPSASAEQLPADDGQWTRPAKDYASTRFSALTEINTSTVKNLRVVTTFSTGVIRGHEAAPLVVG